nr:hypothetical protein [Tanacetum cinerariifolium]
MDDPDITMKEYIQLEAEKACRRGQEFDWEITTYDALTSEPKDSSEPAVSAHHVEKVDFDFVILFDESDDEDYTFTYDKNSFSYKLVFVIDLKLNSDNNDDKIAIKQSSIDISVEPLPDVISIDTQGSNKLLKTSHDTSSKFFKTNTFIMEL